MAENKTDNRIQVEKKLTEISRLSDEEVLNLLQTDAEGLNPLEASSRLEEYGKNIIDSGNENNLFQRVKEAIINPIARYKTKKGERRKPNNTTSSDKQTNRQTGRLSV